MATTHPVLHPLTSKTNIGGYRVIAGKTDKGEASFIFSKDGEYELSRIYNGWKASYWRKLLSGKLPRSITLGDAVRSAAGQLAIKPETLKVFTLDSMFTENFRLPLARLLNEARPVIVREETIYVSGNEPEIRRIVRAAYPDYTGRQFQIVVGDRIHINTSWDGGSKRYWVFVNMATMKTAPVHSEWGNEITIPDNCAAVEHIIFQGKDLGIRIHVPASNMSKALPNRPTNDLSKAEKIVLIATRSYKSSYMGDNQIRFHEAERQTKITRQEWDAAKASCIAKKLLNAAGAITTSGRNAVGNMKFYELK